MPKVAKLEIYKKKYEEEDIAKALQAIAGGLSERKASEQFRIPRSTLQFRSSQNFNNKTTPGPAPVLSYEEENLIKEWIKTSQSKGFPLIIEDIQVSVKQFLDENPRPNVPFPNNKPGRGWFKAFLRRHPDITFRTPEAITSASSNICESDIRKWFTEIETYLVDKGYDHILEDPTRVFNGDETCFLLCPKNKRVLATKGSRNVYQIEHNPKTSLTVMFTFSAAGEITPPMIIYPYKRLPLQVNNSVPGSWGVGCSDNGWMKNQNFYEYIGNVLYKFLVEKGTKFPIIMFVDGHVTHLTYQTSQLCSRLGIILIALYPNATRIMQPADVSAFKPLKVNWVKAVQRFHRDYPRSVVTKENFAPILSTAVAELKPEVIESGFRACGLFPWGANAIDFSKCTGKEKKKVSISPDALNLTTSITFPEFVSVVGEDKINLFRNFDPEDNPDENLQIIFKLYNIFNDKKINDEKSKNHQEITNHNSTDVLKLIELEDVPIIFEEDLDEEIQNVVVDQIENSSDTYNGDNVDVNADTAKPSCSFDSGKMNKSLGEYFCWPQTPERKGKRQSEKLPFVLTSTVRKKAEQAKIERKQFELEEKNRRKEERLKEQEFRKMSKGKAIKGKKTIKKSSKIVKEAQTVTNKGFEKNTSERTTERTEENLVNHHSQSIQEESTSNINLDLNELVANENCPDIKVTTLKKGIKVHLPEIDSPAKKLKVSDSLKVLLPKRTNSESDENISTFISPLKPIRPHSNLDDFSPMPYLPTSTKRILFKDETSPKIKVLSNISINPPNNVNNSFTNVKVCTGLCHGCLLNITSRKTGIRCFSCTREFHDNCVQTYCDNPIVPNKFICKPCSKTNTFT